MSVHHRNKLNITQGYGETTIVIDDPRSSNLTETVVKGGTFETVIVEEGNTSDTVIFEKKNGRDFLKTPQGRENPTSVVIVDLEKPSETFYQEDNQNYNETETGS